MYKHKITYKNAYPDCDDLMFRVAQLDYDLQRLNYDDMHRHYIISALFEHADKYGAAVELDEVASIYNAKEKVSV